MVEHVKDLTSFHKYIGAIVLISDEQIDETGKKVREPVLVFAAGGERVAYIPLSELQKWIEPYVPSKIIKFLTRKKDKEEEFVVEDHGREYGIDQGRGVRMVRYSAWRVDRPNVRGYGKTPNDAIYDLTYNVQPL